MRLDILDTLDRCAALDGLDIFEVVLEGVVVGRPIVDGAEVEVGGIVGGACVEILIPTSVGEEVELVVIVVHCRNLKLKMSVEWHST